VDDVGVRDVSQSMRQCGAIERCSSWMKGQQNFWQGLRLNEVVMSRDEEGGNAEVRD
jgi:hypothetical protein